MINLLENTPNKLSKFRTKKWIKINDKSRGVYNINNDVKFKTTMLKSSLCDYSDANILIKGRRTITGGRADAAAKHAEERDKRVVFKNFAPFTNCKTKTNNTEIDNAKDIHIVMPMDNLKEYSDSCWKTPGSLWQYYKDEPNDNLTDFESFKSKTKITGTTPADGNTKDVEIVLPLKYLNSFWGTLETPLINCEVNPILIWSSTCVITNSTCAGRL